MQRLSSYHVILFLLALTIASISNVLHAETSPQKINVVTTVAPITNIVKNIVGTYANVTGIVPDGTDSHTFEPIPTDAKKLVSADIIIVNGLGLELPTVKLAEKVKKPNVPIVRLADRTLDKKDWRFDSSHSHGHGHGHSHGHGHPNPHLWPNIELTMRYVEVVRDELAALDPDHKAGYDANAKAYLAKLKKLDEAIFACVKTIPEKNRKLVTYHDSFAYFAPRYGMEVIAAIQPADFSEPGPREVIRIIKQIRREEVPAIFGSEVFPSKVMEQIARETGVTFVDQLSDDELPAPPNHSFIGMMADNMSIMVGALGGDSGCVSKIDTSNVSP